MRRSPPCRPFAACRSPGTARPKRKWTPCSRLAIDAGGTLVKPAQQDFWGGYLGFFTDPDGHLWEVAHNPHFPLSAGRPDHACRTKHLHSGDRLPVAIIVGMSRTIRVRLPLEEDIVRPTFRRERKAPKAVSGRSLAATRPGAARSQAPWSRPPSFSIRTRVPRGLDDSKKLTPARARRALRTSSAPLPRSP